MDIDLTEHINDYRVKRDLIVDGLRGVYEFTTPGGAFYLFAKAPIESGSEFVELAIKRGLLVIPGKIFSARDSHFRLSFAASNETLDEGIAVLRELAAH